MQIRWEEKALSDLVEIRAYISRDNPKAADILVNRIVETVGNLKSQPLMGRIGRIPDTRELVIAKTPYLVPYLIEKESITVLRVLHGARQWPDTF